MALQSQLFRGDPKLEAAALSDSAHIVPGVMGEHVRKIQQALIQLDGAAIIPDGKYGPATAAAVLAYKRRRNIINYAYQAQADNIVGKMTIAALDREMLAKQSPPDTWRTCILHLACPPDAGGRAARSNAVGLSLVQAGGAAGPSKADIMAEAVRFGRQCLWDASGDLMSVANALRTNQVLVPAQTKTFNTAVKWLNLSPADTAACVTHLDKAAALMLRNFNVKTSTRGNIVLTHAPGETYHALTNLNLPDLGMKCGDPFFDVDGPNCRRDVVIHEFFHLIGVTHGGGALMGPTIRANITTPAQALDSADNLAQLVAGLRTFKSPNTDACARAGD